MNWLYADGTRCLFSGAAKRENTYIITINYILATHRKTLDMSEGMYLGTFDYNHLIMIYVLRVYSSKTRFRLFNCNA